VAPSKFVKIGSGVQRWGGAAVIAALLLFQIGAASAADAGKAPAKAKHSIKDVMKGAYKGDTSLRSKVIAGTATPAQKQLFLSLTESLAANKPPKGDQTAWDTKVEALVKASHDLLDGSTGAAAAPDASKLAAWRAGSGCE